MKLGRTHPLVRRIRALRRDAARRRSEEILVAEGLHLAEEALAAGMAIELAVVSPELARRPEGGRLLQNLARAGAACHETTPQILGSMQDARSAQPVLLLVRRPAWELQDCLKDEAGPVVVGDSIQDPGNLGSMVRTAAAAGARGLLAAGACADLYHPRTVRAAMGALFRMPALQVELSTALQSLRGHGLRLIGADPRAGGSYLECDLSGSLALIFGSEGAGLGPETARQLDETVRIPMRGPAESLSVGAAAAVLLFEALRQRR